MDSSAEKQRWEGVKVKVQITGFSVFCMFFFFSYLLFALHFVYDTNIKMTDQGHIQNKRKQIAAYIYSVTGTYIIISTIRPPSYSIFKVGQSYFLFNQFHIIHIFSKGQTHLFTLTAVFPPNRPPFIHPYISVFLPLSSHSHSG